MEKFKFKNCEEKRTCRQEETKTQTQENTSTLDRVELKTSVKKLKRDISTQKLCSPLKLSRLGKENKNLKTKVKMMIKTFEENDVRRLLSQEPKPQSLKQVKTIVDTNPNNPSRTARFVIDQLEEPLENRARQLDVSTRMERRDWPRDRAAERNGPIGRTVTGGAEGQPAKLENIVSYDKDF